MNDPYVSSWQTEDERDAAYGIDILRAQLAHALAERDAALAAIERVRALAERWATGDYGLNGDHQAAVMASRTVGRALDGTP